MNITNNFSMGIGIGIGDDDDDSGNDHNTCPRCGVYVHRLRRTCPNCGKWL